MCSLSFYSFQLSNNVDKKVSFAYSFSEIDLYKHEIEVLKEKMLEKNELEEKCISLNQELETLKEMCKYILLVK